MSLLPFEIDWARTIARALVPAGALDGALDHIDAGARYAAEHDASPWHAALVMRLALWLAWTAPVWLHARPRTLGMLDAHAQAAQLEELLAHRAYLVRTTAMFLKLLLCQLLLGDAKTLAQLGAYDLAPPTPLRRSAS